ncbi:MAG: diguanylate cyclase [Sulfuricurvum sp.]|nr:diguanylate cyclase [Sulfuricurvum sp.]
MQRILIVEDNKALAKIIILKLESSLNFEIDVAYSLQEAKLFIKKYSYFLALLDLKLPDAPNGEIVDYALANHLHVIVLSGIVDKNIRKQLLQKDIIDYIKKDGISSIDYIIRAIERLQANQKHKVLIVDDSLVFRNQMQRLLINMFFQVITVAHGEEALAMLQTHPDIKIVLTDYFMPVMDGLELTKKIRKIYSKHELSVIAISSNQDEEITALFLKNGANDYIYKPFSKEEFTCRLTNTIEALENIEKITNNANRDYLTGLYNRRYFYASTPAYFQEAKKMGENFGIAMIDIDNFKAINDTYGHDVGDRVIVTLSQILITNVDAKDTVARFGGEEFCLLLKDMTPSQIQAKCESICRKVAASSLKVEGDFTHFTISIGVVTSPEDTLEESINTADMYLYTAKNSGKNRVVSQ